MAVRQRITSKPNPESRLQFGAAMTEAELDRGLALDRAREPDRRLALFILTQSSDELLSRLRSKKAASSMSAVLTDLNGYIAWRKLEVQLIEKARNRLSLVLGESALNRISRRARVSLEARHG